MPREDQTGPEGRGPLTGKILGRCSGDRVSDGYRGFRRGNRQRLMLQPDERIENGSGSLAKKPASLFDEIIALLEEIRDLKNNMSKITSLVKKIKLNKKSK